MKSITEIPRVAVLALFVAANMANGNVSGESRPEPPKLVVGIVVDQMRHDFIDRYWEQFGEGGFRRLVNEGYSFDNASFDYAPTFTGPGHASIFTGTTPAIHGIIGNTWYVRATGERRYVTEDPDVETVGSDTDAGQMSPRWMYTTTVGDELRVHTNMGSRVVALSLKDRGSILPGGHTGEAYWFDRDSARFITSSYYRNELPGWVRDFNDRELPEKYLSAPWELLLPESAYGRSVADDSRYGGPLPGLKKTEFPHDLPTVLADAGPGAVALTPFGDTLLFELARVALEGENLGRDEYPDILALAFSAPDTVGHRFGPASKEVQDTYLRFDRELEKFLDYLDDRFGMDNVVIFLTSDHGAAHVPAYFEDLGIPAGYLVRRDARGKLRGHLQELYGFDALSYFGNQQVYLDRDLIRANRVPLGEVQKEAARFLVKLDGIADALTGDSLQFGEFGEGIRRLMQRGFDPKRSGDVVYWLQPQWIPSRRFGTTHGSPFSYDTHAPLLWYGWKIPNGRSISPAYISDIAPTLSQILRAPYPNGNIGTPLKPIAGGQAEN